MKVFCTFPERTTGTREGVGAGGENREPKLGVGGENREPELGVGVENREPKFGEGGENREPKSRVQIHNCSAGLHGQVV